MVSPAEGALAFARLMQLSMVALFYGPIVNNAVIAPPLPNEQQQRVVEAPASNHKNKRGVSDTTPTKGKRNKKDLPVDLWPIELELPQHWVREATVVGVVRAWRSGERVTRKQCPLVGFSLASSLERSPDDDIDVVKDFVVVALQIKPISSRQVLRVSVESTATAVPFNCFEPFISNEDAASLKPYEVVVLKHLKRELESFRSDQQKETAEQQRQQALAEQQRLEEEGAEAEGGETDQEPDADGEIIV